LPTPSEGFLKRPMASDSLTAEAQEALALIAEDDPSIGELIKLVLASRGYRSITANNGMEALKLLTSTDHRFSVMLTDLRLPGLNGLELIRAIRKADRNIAIVVVSGRMEGETKDELTAFNITAFLNKPFTLAQLLDTMSLVDGHRKAPFVR